MRIGGTGRIAAAGASLIVLALLSACGGGGTSSTPTPTTTTVPTPTPTATPAPAVNYNTSEYRASTGPSFHGAITAYQAGASGAGITVGVIDSGIADPTGELTGRLSSASRDFAGNANITDVDGHGTAVTMAIAAGRNDRAILGVAWGSTVLTLRTDTTSGCTGTSQFCFTTTAIANALDYAVSNGARVVNISLGGQSATNFLRQAVNRATAAGTIIIVSAGNDHTAAPDPLAQSLADPAISHGLVIIAAAVDQNGGQASFSNGAQGFENTTLSALGVGVTTLDQNGILSSWSGTSLSAPLISGAAALIAQAFPNLTSTQIVQLLLSSATDAGATGADAVYGAGILDLARAFAPQGSLSLAGSTTALSLASTSSLSPAMGDAALAGQSISGVATDRLGRAYGVDLGAGLRAAVPGLRLAPSLRTGIANLSVGTKNTRIALSLTGGQESGASLRRLTLSEEQAQGARLLAAQIAARIAPGTDIAFGLATGSAPLRAMLDDIDNPPFLIARDDSLLTSDLRADRAMRLRQAIGHGLSLSVTAEQGRIAADDRTDANHLGGWRDQDRYAALGLGLSWSHGPLMLSAGATRVAESGTALIGPHRVVRVVC